MQNYALNRRLTISNLVDSLRGHQFSMSSYDSVILLDLKGAIDHGYRLEFIHFQNMAKSLENIVQKRIEPPIVIEDMKPVYRDIKLSEKQVDYLDGDFTAFWKTVSEYTYVDMHSARNEVSEYLPSMAVPALLKIVLGVILTPSVYILPNYYNYIAAGASLIMMGHGFYEVALYGIGSQLVKQGYNKKLFQYFINRAIPKSHLPK